MPRESINAIKGLYPHTINELEDGLSTPPLPEFKPYRIIGTACHDCVKDRLSTPPLPEFKQYLIIGSYPSDLPTISVIITQFKYHKYVTS